MRVTVSHNKGLHGVKKIVEDSADQLIASTSAGPVVVTDVQRRWDASTMHFSFVARMGVFTAPIRGYVQCAEKDVTVDIELPGMLKQFVPEEKMKQQVEGRIKGLLNA